MTGIELFLSYLKVWRLDLCQKENKFTAHVNSVGLTYFVDTGMPNTIGIETKLSFTLFLCFD